MRESGRSTLLMQRMTGIFAASALRSTKRVWGSGPSNASDCQSILSTRVVLPWSTWATMATLRMSARVVMGMRDSLSGFRGWFGPRRRGWFACGSGGASGVRVGRRRAQQLLELLDDGQVGGEPPDGTEVAPVEPAQLVVVLEGLGRALDDLGEPHQHLVPIAQRPRGARLRTGHVRAEAHADAELLEQLAVQGRQRGLALVDLAAGQLPAAGERRRLRAAGRQQSGRSLQVVDDGGPDDEAYRVLDGVWAAHGATDGATARGPGRPGEHGGAFTGDMTRRLTDEEIERQLGDLPDWTRDDDTIRASFEAPDFLTGIALVQEVASAAETMDHHPDIDIRWRTVAFALSTHSEGGLTQLDVELAHQISQEATRRGAAATG